MTDGPNGAFVRYGGDEAHVPAFPCEPKDLTGAGDMFAGAFLYGITHGVAPDRAARARQLPGDEGHHAVRGPAAPRHPAVLGRGPVGRVIAMPHRLRTFIAVDVDTVHARPLVGLQETLAEAGAAVKWVEPQNLHITLLFLGEVDARELPDVCRMVADVCRGLPHFAMTLAGAGAFPNARRPRTLIVPITEGAASHRPARRAGNAAAGARLLPPRRAGVQAAPDPRPGEGPGRRRRTGGGCPQVRAWQGGHSQVREVLVLSSTLRSEGPEYVVLGRGRLK